MMKIYSVYDEEFAEYGRVMNGFELDSFLGTMEKEVPVPDDVLYVAELPALQEHPAAAAMAPSLFGGLPVQFGFCSGHNTKLNCLEYHRSSEFNLGTEDFILILAKASDMKDWKLDTSACKAFRVPKGVLVEVFATAFHYAPCHADPEKGFRVMVALPKGTNVGTCETTGKVEEDRLLRLSNKWLLAHPEAPEASDGAWVGLTGENLDIAGDL